MKFILRAKRLVLFVAIITMGILLSGCSNEDREKKLVGEFESITNANLII